jgi:hypothetical protein
MAYAPYAPQLGAIYTIESVFGKAVLNDPTSEDYAGMVKDVTGLDSADVREKAEDKVQSDGGWHGDFFQGRRPITFTVVLFGHSDMTERETRIDRLRRATKVLRDGHGAETFGTTLGGGGAGGRAHGELSWTNKPEDDNVPMVAYFRRQQPFRVTGPWVKEVQFALVSPFSEIFSQELHSSGPGTLENRGDEDAYPLITVTGASSNVTITNTTTGKKVVLTGASGTVVINVRDHTAYQGTTDISDKINWAQTTWPTLPMGMSTWTASGGTVNIKWRDAWA